VAPGVLDALKILKPQTVIRWHRAGLRTYWRWKSRPHGGRPPRASVAGCDRTPECRLDRPSTDRGLRLAADASLHRSRSRLRLWRYRPQTASRNGHTRSTYLAMVAMAKRIFGEASSQESVAACRVGGRAATRTSASSRPEKRFPSVQFYTEFLWP